MAPSRGLLERARRLAGLSRSELARRAGASRPTLAAYAAGTKSPNLATAERIVRAAGFELELAPRPDFREVAVERGHAVYVPAFLPRLPVDRALSRVRLPLHLNWSEPDREYDLADRRQRARVYEIVLREGAAQDISDYIDGVLLVDLWPDLVMPVQLRRAWQPLVDAVRHNTAV
jgi:transcriptional regulator with XRE-family HTH domain